MNDAAIPFHPPDPAGATRFRMEQQGLRPRHLQPYIGSRGRDSEVMNRRRALTLPMIRRLANGLQIAADVLVREAPLAKAGDATTQKSLVAGSGEMRRKR